MALVKDLYLELTRMVGPARTKAGVPITPTNVGTVDPQRHTKERVLDFYNRARLALFQGFSATRDLETLLIDASDFILSQAITWTQTGSQATAPRPTGYVRFVSMVQGVSAKMILLPNGLESDVQIGTPHYVQSAEKIFIFETATGFIHYGTIVTSGSGYTIRFFGVVPWVIGSVTGGSAIETVDPSSEPILLELGAALSRGMGMAEVNALSRQLVGGKSGA